ncbi:MAG TPA: amylo-alpha-1,6-glucosidase [Chloroflexia bacterium]|nr:amylo-alpha-1,6-glucosidase [Chloroflexia bacterium]
MADTITLKDDFTFLISDQNGELLAEPQGHGLYFEDTRYLSRLELFIDGKRPQLLSSNQDYNIAAAFHLSSAFVAQLQSQDVTLAPAWATVHHAIGLIRRRYIRKGLIESLEFTNFHSEPVKIDFSLYIESDFADIFEVRGFERELRGQAGRLEVRNQGKAVLFQSLINPERTLYIESDIQPASYELAQSVSALNGLTVPGVWLNFSLVLPPNRATYINTRYIPGTQTGWKGEGYPTLTGAQASTMPESFAEEVAQARRIFNDWRTVCSKLEIDDFRLGKVFETSLLDLRSLMQQEPHGLVVTAGLPWYFTLFGRDSLITAIQTLALNPQIAIDTLRALAAYQATAYDDWRDSEPGKILHELRRGDMTLQNAMPHGPYYGSIDSTLLFIICFCKTLDWLNDDNLFAELWPNIERALEWAEKYGEQDDSGYIKFQRRSQRGILHPGWKDSDESMGGALGPRPVPPVALVEVQGYYYDALVSLAALLRRKGDKQPLAERLAQKAARLKENFNRDFWWEEEGFLVQALDGQNKPVRNVTSNPGHCLWSGIVDQDKAVRVVNRLLQPDMLCGWGIRTMSSKDPTYNPMSYHNGSVWPHDNALIIAGLRRYGFDSEAMRVATQIFDAAYTFKDYRLPELYCGFERVSAGVEEFAPAAYPVSCSPQAWAAGTPILLLQVMLDLQPDAQKQTVSSNPLLPIFLRSLKLKDLRVGDTRLDLVFSRDSQNGRIDFNIHPALTNRGINVTAG